MKRLGFGLMRLPLTNPDDEGSVDIDRVKEMADMFIEKGFTYFDTAWGYMDYKSENAAYEAIVRRHKRDEFQLATKLHSSYIHSFGDRDRIFNEQLSKTKAGYFDYYLLHGINAESIAIYEKFDCFNWLQEKKKSGLVRHAGFSFHDKDEVLDDILTNHPEVEFVQLQINYLDWDSEWVCSGKCYETALRHKKPVIVMEPVKGGALAKLPPKAEKLFKDYDPSMSAASWAVRFAASLDGVMMVLSGMSDISQVKDNLSFMEDFKPLSEEEISLCRKAADIINSETAVPCTGCSYCTAGCPMNIPIPKLFSVYNESIMSKSEGWDATYNSYAELKRKFASPKDCVKCAQCESVCPQHLHITDLLESIVSHYERDF